MPSAESQIHFLTNLQRLLSEGSFVSTYKYALLMALADIAVERGSDDDRPLEISTRLIAEKFIDYYWRQSTPFVSAAGSEQLDVLRQNTGKQAGIIRVLVEARTKHDGSLVEARSSANWRRMTVKVDSFVRTMPLWKLQSVGGQKLDFLYDNVGRGDQITLKPGVVYCLRKHYPMVADLVKGAWARYVRRFNGDLLGEQADLGDFLFGSERANLGVVVPILQEFQHGECFYCRRPLKGETAHVDHFIPWSRYPVDLGHNFVLAHAKCNGKKSDRLAADEHLERWAIRQQVLGADMTAEFKRQGIISDTTSSARIVNWAYNQTYDNHGLTWVRADELRVLRPEWNRSLDRLVN